MPKSLTVVIYKHDSQSTDELMVYVDPVQYRKWKEGDTSIPLVDIVDTFSIYYTGQGVQGLQKRPSNQQLDTIFGTHNEESVIEHILRHGRQQHGDSDPEAGFLDRNRVPSRNISRGNAAIDNKGRR